MCGVAATICCIQAIDEGQTPVISGWPERRTNINTFLPALLRSKDFARNTAIVSESQSQAVQKRLVHTKPYSKNYNRLSEELRHLLDEAAQMRRIEHQIAEGIQNIMN